ncbi:glycosyltransferase [Rhodobacterales bacterium LSUCC0387]|nr:glycosyltransferase [Rhodobacterales bacterium LSUCC0387]
MTMKIIFVVSDLNKENGGKAHAALAYMKALRQFDVDIVIICTKIDFDFKRKIIEDLGICPNSIYNISKLNITSLSFIKGLLSIIIKKNNKYHFHGVFDWLAFILPILISGDYFISPHGMLNAYGYSGSRKKKLFYNLVLRKFFRKSSGVVFTSEKEQKETILNIGVQRRECIVPIPVIFNSKIVRLNSGKSNLLQFGSLRAAGKIHVGTIGRIETVKNIENLLFAVAETKSVILSIAGDGDPRYLARLRQIALKLNIEDRVVWHGLIDEDYKIQLLFNLDLYVQASWSESFGLAALEAAMVGVPVLCSTGVAVSTDLHSIGACTVCDPSVEGIRAGLDNLCRSGDFQEENRQSLSQKVGQKFCANTVGSLLVALYKD